MSGAGVFVTAWRRFSIHWPVEGTEILSRRKVSARATCFSIHWPVEGTEILGRVNEAGSDLGFSIHWPVEGTEMSA